MIEDLDELDDFEISPASYEVWILGYTRFDTLTAFEYLVGGFDNPDAAIDRAKSFTISSLPELNKELSSEVAYFSIEVETVVDGLNSGTIYKRCLENIHPPINLWISENAYELTEAGNLRIKHKECNKVNVGSYINLNISERPTEDSISLKVIMKDSCSITCEFID